MSKVFAVILLAGALASCSACGEGQEVTFVNEFGTPAEVTFTHDEVEDTFEVEPLSHRTLVFIIDSGDEFTVEARISAQIVYQESFDWDQLRERDFTVVLQP
jgi:hypothetical protein